MPRSEKNLVQPENVHAMFQTKKGWISCLENPNSFCQGSIGSGSFAVFGAALQLLSLEFSQITYHLFHHLKYPKNPLSLTKHMKINSWKLKCPFEGPSLVHFQEHLPEASHGGIHPSAGVGNPPRNRGFGPSFRKHKPCKGTHLNSNIAGSRVFAGTDWWLVELFEGNRILIGFNYWFNKTLLRETNGS